MNYNEFERIISLLEACHNTSIKPEKCYDMLIDELFKQLYDPIVVDNILVEWLKGNRNPVYFTSDDGTQVTFQMRTLKDLYRCMKRFKRKRKKQ